MFDFILLENKANRQKDDVNKTRRNLLELLLGFSSCHFQLLAV